MVGLTWQGAVRGLWANSQRETETLCPAAVEERNSASNHRSELGSKFLPSWQLGHSLLRDPEPEEPAWILKPQKPT